ncbi:unnamed protein product [Mytilus coruscus]|uniref:Uncharacterized protein n=1 Tax=Mytilus coruscus TaxID=42192 RepID=A0A6J8DA91_MYTCO|nr:unnamed protein product [Mytilus coruscus]
MNKMFELDLVVADFVKWSKIRTHYFWTSGHRVNGKWYWGNNHGEVDKWIMQYDLQPPGSPEYGDCLAKYLHRGDTAVGKNCGGLRIWLSASCYESFRWALNTFYDNKRKENDGNIIYKKVFDKSETVNVEDQYKIKCEGFDRRGRNIKLSCFSINMYHTTSSLLVNGKKLLVFINDHLPEVLNCMKNYQINGKPVDLNMLNKCIYDMISVNFPEQKNHSNSTTTNEKSCEKIELSQAKSIISITSNTCTNAENKNIHEDNSEISTENNSNMKNKEDIKEIHSDTGIVRQPLQNVNELLQARENITQDENSVKSFLHQLLDKTDSLFELVKSTDEQRIEEKQDFQNKINQVNDRITAFSKQMCTNDEHQAEHLREIENSVKLVKIEQDKNFSQVHNKIQSL